MRLAQDAEIEENGVAGVGDMIYFKQRVGNACGTFALLHALGNSSVELEAGVLRELFQRCVDKTPLERAELLETSGSISEAHQSAASTGNQTAVSA